MEQLFEAILAIAKQNPDGFTVDLTTLKKVTKGISVAYLETQDNKQIAIFDISHMRLIKL